MSGQEFEGQTEPWFVSREMGEPNDNDRFFRNVEFYLHRDFPNCTPATGSRFQGHTDTCYAFVVVNCIFAHFLVYEGQAQRGSEQNLLDCLHLEFASKASVKGTPSKAGFPNNFRNAFEYIKKHGLFLNQDYPWAGVLQDCRNHRTWVDSIIKIDHFESLSTTNEVVEALKKYHLVTASIYVTKKLKTWRGTNIYILDDAEKRQIDVELADVPTGFHALTVIGYGNEGGIAYFLTQCSWGRGWGYDGFMKVGRDCLSKFYYVASCRLAPGRRPPPPT